MKRSNSSDDDELMTPKQLAAELAVSQAWIRDHVSGRRQPPLPHIRLGERRALLRFRKSEIAEFLKRNTRNVAQ